MRVGRAAPWSVTSLGSAAAALFDQDASRGSCTPGSVIAAFRRSVYIDTPRGIVCVAVPQIGPGPMTVLLRASLPSLPFSLQSGDAVAFADGRLTLPRRHVIDATGASLFDGACHAHTTDQHRLMQRREALARLDGVPTEGLGCLLTSLAPGPLLSVAQRGLLVHTLPTIRQLHAWLQHRLQDHALPAPACTRLLGAGPGLTPSGDDLLAGAMLALYSINHACAAGALWSHIEADVAHSTHPISAAHLALAARGRCGRHTLTLLDTLLGDRRLDVARTRCLLDAMGATSGWDTLAGIALVMDAALASQRHAPALADRRVADALTHHTVNTPC